MLGNISICFIRLNYVCVLSNTLVLTFLIFQGQIKFNNLPNVNVVWEIRKKPSVLGGGGLGNQNMNIQLEIFN